LNTFTVKSEIFVVNTSANKTYASAVQAAFRGQYSSSEPATVKKNSLQQWSKDRCK